MSNFPWWGATGLIVGAAIGLSVVSPAKETVHRPPNLGAPSGEAHGIRTNDGYRPKFGNNEHANFYSASGCGVERWAVKTLTDPGANQVNLTPQQTNIADLVSITPPVSPTDRVGPTETQAFTLSGVVTFVKQEADGDYHIVVQDATGNSMIVESAKPSCAQGSLVANQIAEVRSAVEAKFPSGSARGVQVPVTVTGIGFFDRLHGQTGVAPNGIELHPLTQITFTPALSSARVRVPDLHLMDNPSSD